MRINKVYEFVAVCDICGSAASIKIKEAEMSKGETAETHFRKKGWGGCHGKAICRVCSETRVG